MQLLICGATRSPTLFNAGKSLFSCSRLYRFTNYMTKVATYATLRGLATRLLPLLFYIAPSNLSMGQLLHIISRRMMKHDEAKKSPSCHYAWTCAIWLCACISTPVGQASDRCAELHPLIRRGTGEIEIPSCRTGKCWNSLNRCWTSVLI